METKEIRLKEILDDYYLGFGNYMKSYIYKTYCVLSDTVWINETFNMDIAKMATLYQLKKGYHLSKELQEDYNTWGKDYIQFELLDIVSSPHQIQDKVEFYKQLYKLK